MAWRPHELEGAPFELDHLHTNATETLPTGTRRRQRASMGGRLFARFFPRHTRETRRAGVSVLGLIGAALAMLFAGGAVLSGASGAPNTVNDPLANAVRAFGGAPSFGPSTGMRLNAGFVDLAATPSGRGYWITAADGGVFTFGDAHFHGSIGGRQLAAPIVGIAATPTGRGYWLVGSDGGVFAFGDAAFHGSMVDPGTPIVAIASTPSGRGYWLVGSDGGVFAFGDAAFEGAATSFEHRAPLVGIAPTASGYGYLLLGADGGVFAFGDAHFQGAVVDGRHLATAIAIPRNGRGYEVASTDGNVFGFGGAPSFTPAADGLAAQHPVVALATRRGGGAWLATTLVPPAPVVAQSSSPSQDPFLRCTRAHESDSAGGYRAVSPGGVYRGAYQFLPSTWNNVARAAGRPDLVGVDPAVASPADQDQLALFLFQHAGPGPWGGRCGGLS
jgi:hypothetical protein